MPIKSISGLVCNNRLVKTYRKINAIGRHGTLKIKIPAFCFSSNRFTVRVYAIPKGDEGRASPRVLVCWKPDGRALTQIKQGTVTGEGKV